MIRPRRISLSSRGRMAHGTLLVFLATGLGSMLLPGVASAGRAQWSLFEDNRHLVNSDAATRQDTLDQIKALGADTLRISVGWATVAPSSTSKKRPSFDESDPLAYPGFGPFDDVIVRATAMGFRVLITLGPDAPRWATRGGRGGNYNVDASSFARFAKAVGRRYSGEFPGLPKVQHWSLWNEPNHYYFLKPRSRAPRIYRRMVGLGLPALRSAAPAGSKIFVGELAPVGTDTKVIGPLSFLRKWLCLDNGYRRLTGRRARSAGCRRFKRVRTDGFAHHPYGLQAGNRRPPKGRDVINISVIRRLGSALNKAAKRRRLPKHLPIYSTEFGFQSSPPDPFVGISLTRQAQYLNQAEEFSYRYSRLKSFSQYLLYDDPPRAGSSAVRWSGFQTGLRFAGGSQKPSFDAWRLPLVVRKRGRGVRVWGRVRPGSGIRLVELARRRGGRFVPESTLIKTNSQGYFSVKRRARARYRFTGYVVGAGGERLAAGTSRIARIGH